MTGTTYEVEIKLPVKDRSKLLRKLDEIGVRWTDKEKQVDTYFQHPMRSFEATDEALRLRQRTLMPSNQGAHEGLVTLESELTYKGPKIDPTTKTRVEYSTGILDFEKARAIFLSLGFSDVATVTKERTYCEYDQITLSIDDVEGLGTFTELELVVEGEGAVEAARSQILTLRILRYCLHSEERDD